MILALEAFGFKKLPTAFIPTEDQGYFMIQCELQPGASLVETMQVMEKAGVILDSIPGVKAHVSISGNSVSEQAQISSKATMFVILDDWSERVEPEKDHLAIIQRFNKTAAATVENATLYAFMTFSNPPKAATDMSIVEDGRWKFVTRASGIAKS